MLKHSSLETVGRVAFTDEVLDQSRARSATTCGPNPSEE